MRPRRSTALLAAFAAFGVFWGGWSAVLPAVRERAGASDAELGLALLCIALAAIPAMVAAGPLIDRLGPRAVPLSLAAFAAAALVPALATSPVALGAALLLVGAGSGALDVAMNAGVADYEAAEGRRLMHKAHAMFPLGVVGASLAVGAAREAGAGAAPVLVVLALLVAVAVAPNAAAAGRRGAVPARRARVRLTRPLLLLGGLGALAYLVENALQVWSAIHLEETLGAPPVVGGLGPALFAAAMFAGRALAQTAGEGVGDRALISLAGAGGAAGVAVAAAAGATWLVLAGFAVAGLALAVAAPTVFAAAGRAGGPGGRAASISTVTTVSYLGFLAGPPLVGLVAEAAGLRVGLASLALAGVALAVAAPLTRGAEPVRA